MSFPRTVVFDLDGTLVDTAPDLLNTLDVILREAGAPPRVNLVMDAISMVVIAVFGLFISWYGFQLAARTWDTRIPGLGITGATDFLPLICAGLLFTLFAIERIVNMHLRPDSAGVAVSDATLSKDAT